MSKLQNQLDKLVAALQLYNLYYGPHDKRVGENWPAYKGDYVSQCIDSLQKEINRRDGSHAKTVITINRPTE